MHVATTPAFSPNLGTEWIRKLTAYRLAKDEYERYEENVVAPISNWLDRIAPYPGCSIEVTAANGQTAKFSLFPADLHALDNHSCASVRAEAAALRARWEQHSSAREVLNYDTASTESERLCDIMCKLEEDVMVAPAPDRETLLWKLERLFGPEACEDDGFCASWCAKWINAVMDDARRLIPSPVRYDVMPSFSRAA